MNISIKLPDLQHFSLFYKEESVSRDNVSRNVKETTVEPSDQLEPSYYVPFPFFALFFWETSKNIKI